MNNQPLSILFSDDDGLYQWHKDDNNCLSKRYIVSFKHNDLINAINTIGDIRFDDLN